MIVRLLTLAAILILLPVFAPRAGAAVTPACRAPVTLVLQPGAHFPGAGSIQIPADLPPGTITLHLPLYPDAVPTSLREPHPALATPATTYVKSVSTTFYSSADTGTLIAWYRQALGSCGFPVNQSGDFGMHGRTVSSSIASEQKEGRNDLWIILSFEAAPHGGTLILYLALAVTPPVYPAPGKPLRIPGTPAGVTIIRYSGMSTGAPLRPISEAVIRNPFIATSLANQINVLPKPASNPISCPFDDGSHLSLVFTLADGARLPVYIALRGCEQLVTHSGPAALFVGATPLLPRILALLQRYGHTIPPPYLAGVRPTAIRMLAKAPSRFLALSNPIPPDSLFLQGNDLYLLSAGRPARLLAHGVTDAAFTTNGASILIQRGNHISLLDRRTGRERPIALPKHSSFLSSAAGPRLPTLSDASGPPYVWMVQDGHILGFDPTISGDSIRSPWRLPAGALVASCGEIETYWSSRSGLVVRSALPYSHPDIIRHLASPRPRFLDWAPDCRRLAIQQGDRLLVFDTQTGTLHPVLPLHGAQIFDSAWDPWSSVIALALGPPDRPEAGRLLLANADGSGNSTLPLTGVTHLDWAGGRGETIGVTRETAQGPQAYLIALPSLPPDPGIFGR